MLNCEEFYKFLQRQANGSLICFIEKVGITFFVLVGAMCFDAIFGNKVEQLSNLSESRYNNHFIASFWL